MADQGPTNDIEDWSSVVTWPDGLERPGGITAEPRTITAAVIGAELPDWVEWTLTDDRLVERVHLADDLAGPSRSALLDDHDLVVRDATGDTPSQWRDRRSCDEVYGITHVHRQADGSWTTRPGWSDATPFTRTRLGRLVRHRAVHPQVLVVEDEADLAFLVTINLELAGISSLASFDWDHAKRLLQRSRPALVLTGIMMPRTDGWQGLRWLRSHPALHDVPAVVYTAIAEDRAQLRAYVLGAQHVVVKPFEMSGLLDVITRQLSAGPLRPDRPGPEGPDVLDLVRAADAQWWGPSADRFTRLSAETAVGHDGLLHVADGCEVSADGESRSDPGEAGPITTIRTLLAASPVAVCQPCLRAQLRQHVV